MTRNDNSPVLAVDIGGTKIMIAIITSNGKIMAKDIFPTMVEQGVDSVIGRVYSSIESLLDRNELTFSQLYGIGVACAGGVDTGRGVVVTPSPNLPDWIDIPLAAKIQERYKTDTFMVNDASAAALGEHRFGAGRGMNNLILFTLGTGIGGGIIADGRLYLGACGGAAELGHMTVDEDGPECGCGNTGCLEMLASGKAVARDTIRRLKGGEKSSLTEIVKGRIEDITAEQVEMAALNGDALAMDVFKRTAYYLGIGMVNVVNIFNPEMIVLGGGMARLNHVFIDTGKQMVTERCFPISSRIVRIVNAELGNEAGIFGMAAFVREKVKGGQDESP